MWGGGILYWICHAHTPRLFWRNKIQLKQNENKKVTIHSILVHLTLPLIQFLPLSSFNPSFLRLLRLVAAIPRENTCRSNSQPNPPTARPSTHLTDDIKLGEETASRWRTFINYVLVYYSSSYLPTHPPTYDYYY